MTNEAIIEEYRKSLVAQGILKIISINGIEMPEPIHTFNGWKERGYKVKKGEKSFIKLPIWKHTTKTVKVDDKEEERSAMFVKTSAFFTLSQVEKIKNDNAL